MNHYAFACALCLTMSAAFCADLELNGQSTQTIPLQSHTQKTISLLNIKLSSHAQQALTQRAQDITLNAPLPQAPSSRTLPSMVSLGMQQIPVLDQGQHGTCVTFAVSAALDAAIGQEDYISQLCALQLGRYLSAQGYQPSGWEGSWAQTVLAQFNTFGMVNTTQQKTHGCGGMTLYPSSRPSSSEMSIEEYRQYSEPLHPLVTWSVLLDQYQVFADKTDMHQVLTQVKTALYNQHRVTFGVLIPPVQAGIAGAVGWRRYWGDTWVLTPEVQHLLGRNQALPAHEMIITGYDDEAIAMDNHGQRHQGLLTLRNSWGYLAGEWGNYYMSYDYFKTLAIEAVEIIPSNH